MKRFVISVFVFLVILSGVTLAAKKPLALVRSLKTIDKPVNYPSYVKDFDAFEEWLAGFAEFDIITDLDVEKGILKNYEAALLPDNAVMGSDEADAYFDFVDAGGKLFGCYSTSLRTVEGKLTSYQLSDIFGVTWITWTNAKDKHNFIQIEPSHKIFKGLPKEGITNIGSSVQVSQLNQGDALGSWFNADKVTESESEEKNACIIENEGSIFVSFPITTSGYFNHPEFGLLLKNIIAYIAPQAIK
jgi:hypothetical protein